MVCLDDFNSQRTLEQWGFCDPKNILTMVYFKDVWNNTIKIMDKQFNFKLCCSVRVKDV